MRRETPNTIRFTLDEIPKRNKSWRAGNDETGRFDF
jgi:hypothetical protein